MGTVSTFLKVTKIRLFKVSRYFPILIIFQLHFIRYEYAHNITRQFHRHMFSRIRNLGIDVYLQIR